MRCLIACEACKRQYDATGIAAGSRFYCHCGESVQVPKVLGQAADVVRCSSCGAARKGDGLQCGYCGADFTVHERDMQTICPSCMARISGKARYCHRCATPILPQGRVGDETDRACPACGDERHLSSRMLGKPAMELLECQGCAGLWIGNDSLQRMLERARSAAAPIEAVSGGSPTIEPSARPSAGRAYRRCPVCAKPMNRRNYGRKSGVIVDACRADGVWFDAHELGQVLEWVRRGGESVAARREADEARHAERQARHGPVLPSTSPQDPYRAGGGNPFEDGGLVGGLIGLLFDR